jgi:hypothetical protein
MSDLETPAQVVDRDCQCGELTQSNYRSPSCARGNKPMNAYKWSDSLAVVIRTADGVRVATAGARDRVGSDTLEYLKWLDAGNRPDFPDCSQDPELPALEWKHLRALQEMGLPFTRRYLDAARLSPALIVAYIQCKGLL